MVIEPFITPALFQKYPTAIDEWSLSVAMAADTASGGLDQLEEHYKTFIVRSYLFCFAHTRLIARYRPRRTSLKLPALVLTTFASPFHSGRSTNGKESLSLIKSAGSTPLPLYPLLPIYLVVDIF